MAQIELTRVVGVAPSRASFGITKSDAMNHTVGRLTVFVSARDLLERISDQTYTEEDLFPVETETETETD